jgi:CheY-like chemotaxis protein
MRPDTGAPMSDTRPVVVVSEDELLVRMFTADFLDEAGYNVFQAANADEALALLRTRSDVQVLVTDVEMPQGAMNGFALARRVREELPGVAIMIVSGRAYPEPGDMPPGAMFLSKPFDPTRVLNGLRDLIARQGT